MNPMNSGVYFDIMAIAQKHYSRHLEPICKKWNLTRSEVDVLLFLYNNPRFDRAADIVNRRGIAKSHVSLSVKNLESRRLLVRGFAPGDRRAAHLSLTEQGRFIAEESSQAQQRFFRTLYEGITEGEFAQWRDIIQKVHNNIENMEKTE